MDSLPIDFEEKVKQPPAVGGVGGYPYSISAKDLMKNFVYAAVAGKEFPDVSNGIEFFSGTGQGGHKSREIWCVKVAIGENNGDMLYWDSTSYEILAAPSAGAILWHDGTKPVWLEAPSGGDGISVLTHDGTTPSWTATEECT